MDLLGMFSGSVSKVIKSVGVAIDNTFTSDEEKLKLKKELKKIEINADIEIHKLRNEFEKEVTARWNSDNEHQVTRLVRPSLVIWTFALFTIVVLFDGNVGDFTVNPAYIVPLTSIVTVVVGAYFGGRSIEKVSKIVKNYRKDKIYPKV